MDTHKLGGEVKGLNPSWGEAVFCIENVEKDDLDKISVEITVKDRRSLGSVIHNKTKHTCTFICSGETRPSGM